MTDQVAGASSQQIAKNVTFPYEKKEKVQEQLKIEKNQEIDEQPKEELKNDEQQKEELTNGEYPKEEAKLNNDSLTMEEIEQIVQESSKEIIQNTLKKLNLPKKSQLEEELAKYISLCQQQEQKIKLQEEIIGKQQVEIEELKRLLQQDQKLTQPKQSFKPFQPKKNNKFISQDDYDFWNVVDEGKDIDSKQVISSDL